MVSLTEIEEGGGIEDAGKLFFIPQFGVELCRLGGIISGPV